MKEHPILFSGPMVRAILDGKKTQTRRVIKPQPKLENYLGRTGKQLYGDPNYYHFSSLTYHEAYDLNWCGEHEMIKCPYGQVGDRLWVRETWDFIPEDEKTVQVAYAVDGKISETISVDMNGWNPTIYNYQRWRPSIHMPRWASRITLEITDIRVERLQDITEEDAVSEGVKYYLASGGKQEEEMSMKAQFSSLWNSINEKRGYGWDTNPWVWVIEFKVVKP